MQTVGTIKGKSGHTLMIEVDNIPDIADGEALDITFKKHREKRSLNANAYFHKLCDELRQKLRISFTHCKNILITSYGQMEYIDDGVPAQIDTNIEPEKMNEQELLHCRLIAFDEGVYSYVVYRGSHTYNTHEMSILIDGTVQECKLQGIETMTPDELMRLEGYERG